MEIIPIRFNNTTYIIKDSTDDVAIQIIINGELHTLCVASFSDIRSYMIDTYEEKGIVYELKYQTYNNNFVLYKEYYSMGHKIFSKRDIICQIIKK